MENDEFMSAGAAVMHRETVPPKTPWSRLLEPGEHLTVVDSEGQQAVDFLCFGSALPVQRLSVPNTIKLNRSLYLTTGTRIYSELAQLMFTVVDDTCGLHDTLAGCCSIEMDELRYAAGSNESCRTNFIGELARWGMGPADIVSNINLFMRVEIGTEGEVDIVESISKPGDYVTLRAEMPVLCVLSNCPQQNNPSAGFAPTPIEVVVWTASPR